MAIFGSKKKAEKQSPCCGCNGCASPDGQTPEGAPVLVLGSGCEKCNELEANTREALAELGMDDAVGHVTDFAQIAAFGVMSTPALVVDGKVLSFGKVLKKDEISKLLQKVRE